MLDGYEWSTRMPLSLYPREERAGWASGPVWTGYSEDKHPLPGAVKSVASRCTDYVIPAPFCCHTQTENIQAFRGACSQRVHSADAVRMGSSNSPFSVKLYARAFISFLAGIIILSVDSIHVDVTAIEFKAETA